MGPAFCSLSPLQNVLALKLCTLRDEKVSLALRSIPLSGPLSAKVSAYGDDITVFVSRRLYIKAVKKAIVRVRADSWGQDLLL